MTRLHPPRPPRRRTGLAILPRASRRTTAALIVAALGLLVLAWHQGGDRPVRPIEEDVAVPRGVL